MRVYSNFMTNVLCQVLILAWLNVFHLPHTHGNDRDAALRKVRITEQEFDKVIRATFFADLIKLTPKKKSVMP